MMWFRRNIVALIVSALFVGMIGVSLYLLKQAKTRQAEAESRYNDLRNQFDNEIRKSIFPSPKNMEILQNQRQQMTDSFSDIFEHLPKQARTYNPMSPWAFIGYLETQLSRLEQYCRASQMQVPTGFSFGFSKYRSTTEPPKQELTPLLLHQLDIVERIVRLLAQAKVSDLMSVKRTFAEGEPDTREDRIDGGVWNKDPGLLYESQNVQVDFRCTNEQLRNVLNSMASSTNILLLVRNISVQAERTVPATPKDTAAAPGGGGTAKPGTTARPSVAPGMMPGVPGTPMPAPTGRGVGGRGSRPTQSEANVPSDVPIVLGNEIATVSLRLDVIEMKLPSDKADAAASKPPPKNGPRKNN